LPRGLPVVPVHDLIEWPTVRPAERAERAVGGIAQADHVYGEVAVGESQHPPRLLLVADGRMARADAQVCGGQHHESGRLPEVIQQPVVAPLVFRFVGRQHDRRRRTRDVPAAPLPGSGQLGQLLAAGDDHKVLRLPVL